MRYKIFAVYGASLDLIHVRLNELAEDGWRVVSTYTIESDVFFVMGREHARIRFDPEMFTEELKARFG